MFKGFQNKSRQFNGFPNLNFQVNNEAYGFSGCTFWLDAAYGLNTQTNLAAVSSWTDKISNTTFTQATAGNQPRFILSNTSYNNLPTVEGFDNARRMNCNNKVIVMNTLCFVANYNVLNAGTAFNALFGSQTVNAWQVGLGGGVTGVNGVFLRDTAAYVSGTTESTSVKIVIITPSGIWVNGVNEFSGTTQLSQRTFDQIFCAFNAATQSLIGNIAEILIYSADYSNSITLLSSNINSKYAIY